MNITIKQIEQAKQRLKGVVIKTPLQFSKRLSAEFGANIYLKREDLNEVRSFKIRGAYNKMATLTNIEKKQGIVTASAGNHAQGVALSCFLLKIHGTIFMPFLTPNQKIERVKQFGDGFVKIKLIGQTYDDAGIAAKNYCKEKSSIYIHPFNDVFTIAGQGTVGLEVYEDIGDNLDAVVGAIGGGGLISGVSLYLKEKNKRIKIFGAEPFGSPSMHKSLERGEVTTLDKIDTFVDGAAVQTVGNITFDVCKKNLEKVLVVPEGKICTTMIELYQNEGIISEPAGALSISALDNIKDQIKGKTVVCILSGGNNDLLRYPEIVEKSLVWQERKHYFLIEFAQKPGQLKKFLNEAMGPTDDIVRFEYMKKTNREKGAAFVGIELLRKEDLDPLLSKMKEIELNFKIVTPDDLLYNHLV